jgi:hypothetical protein
MAAQTPPSPGAIYAAKMPNGLFSACQILGLAPTGAWHAIALDGTWPEPPSIEQTAQAGVLRQQRLHFDGSVCEGYVTGSPPESFMYIGTAAVPANRAGQKSIGPVTVWDDVLKSVFHEWRWVHDRKAFQSEIDARAAEQRAARKKRMAAEDAERAERIAGLSLEKFRKENLFANWAKLPGKEVAEKAQSIFNKAIDDFIAQGEKHPAAASKKILKRVITEFNALDKAHNGCIETGERENIIGHFKTLADLVAFKPWKDIADSRDW